MYLHRKLTERKEYKMTLHLSLGKGIFNLHRIYMDQSYKLDYDYNIKCTVKM